MVRTLLLCILWAVFVLGAVWLDRSAEAPPQMVQVEGWSSDGHWRGTWVRSFRPDQPEHPGAIDQIEERQDSEQIMRNIVEDLVSNGKVDEALVTVRESLADDEAKDYLRLAMIRRFVLGPLPVPIVGVTPEYYSSLAHRDWHYRVWALQGAAQTVGFGEQVTEGSPWALLLWPRGTGLAWWSSEGKSIDEEKARQQAQEKQLHDDRDSKYIAGGRKIVSEINNGLVKAEALRTLEKHQRNLDPAAAEQMLQAAADLAKASQWIPRRDEKIKKPLELMLSLFSNWKPSTILLVTLGTGMFGYILKTMAKHPLEELSKAGTQSVRDRAPGWGERLGGLFRRRGNAPEPIRETPQVTSARVTISDPVQETTNPRDVASGARGEPRN
jgi:hypothetical protein